MKQEPEDIILLGKFKSVGEAYCFIEEDFLNEIALLRANRYICSEKLETKYNRNKAGVIDERYYLGKVKFSKNTIVEDEDEGDILVGNYIVILRYSLNEFNQSKKIDKKESGKSVKKKKLEEKIWVLEKHIL